MRRKYMVCTYKTNCQKLTFVLIEILNNKAILLSSQIDILIVFFQTVPSIDNFIEQQTNCLILNIEY